MKEATKTPMTTLKEFKASAAEMQEALQTTTVAQAHQSKLYGGVAKRKQLLNIAHLIMTRVHSKVLPKGGRCQGAENYRICTISVDYTARISFFYLKRRNVG